MSRKSPSPPVVAPKGRRSKLPPPGSIKTRATILKDGRAKNSGKPGNSGGKKGRSGAPWAPTRKTVDNAKRDGLRLQTQDEAWEDARRMVRHYTAIGYPVDVIGRLLSPVIRDEATVRKHFAWELENGREYADAQVAGVAFAMAVSGRHESMTRWWASRRLEGFGDKVIIGTDKPIEIRTVPGDEGL